jgi:ribosomal protein S18 acetylase RimI-like enzyme
LKLPFVRETNKINIRKAKIYDSDEILRVLSHAFEPYKGYYTEEAHKATILNHQEIENRIRDKKVEILVALYENIIVGTITLRFEKNGNIYLQSMAIIPNYQGKGVGKQMLERVEITAKQRKGTTMSLECYYLLKKAVDFYKKSGFYITGRKRNYYGIQIFEMVKELKN